MGPFEMVVAIVLIVTIGQIVRHKTKFQQEGSAAPRSADTARLSDEIRALKDRVQVLERVITENHSSASLDREIEKLRDSDRI